MVRKFFYSIIALFVVLTDANAQTFTLQGRVTDSQMNPIELASVQVVKQGKSTLTSLKGEFSMDLQSADSVEVRFSMIGYQTKTRILRNPRGKQTLQIILNESDHALGEVSVTELRRQTTQTQELKKEDMKNAPSTTGNAVEEMIQSQAGVSTHSELSSQYNVRGGSFDENSVYINNVEIYRPFLVRSTFRVITPRMHLNPPAVLPAQPPMNITMPRIIHVMCGHAPTSSLNTPVVVVKATTWNSAFLNACSSG